MGDTRLLAARIGGACLPQVQFNRVLRGILADAQRMAGPGSEE